MSIRTPHILQDNSQPELPNPLNRFQFMLDRASRAGEIHQHFLNSQQKSFEQMRALLEMHIAAVRNETSTFIENPPEATKPLFDKQDLQEFATGSMAKCFGSEFNIFEGRRYPRIPNGDLMLMSRILEISGQRLQFNHPARITAEYDVPQDAWYFQASAFQSIPYSVWMEIALQPCGFLSAFMGTSLIFPNMDFYFRNLDGNARLLVEKDLRGKTITTKARLISTTASDNTIIQKFDFELSSQGETVFRGESIFGFFPQEVMAKQAGLDSGKSVAPLYEVGSLAVNSGEWIDLISAPGLSILNPNQNSNLFAQIPGGQLNLLERVFIGRTVANQPYLYAVRSNDPLAWFYPCHFYQDPVMPGSLGVEAILQALKVYALSLNRGRPFQSPCFGSPVDLPLTWKYRGQILQKHQQMKLEVKITRVEQTPEKVTVEGDASLWADAVRIYEVKHAAVTLQEG